MLKTKMEFLPFFKTAAKIVS